MTFNTSWLACDECVKNYNRIWTWSMKQCSMKQLQPMVTTWESNVYSIFYPNRITLRYWNPIHFFIFIYKWKSSTFGVFFVFRLGGSCYGNSNAYFASEPNALPEIPPGEVFALTQKRLKILQEAHLLTDLKTPDDGVRAVRFWVSYNVPQSHTALNNKTFHSVD